MKRTLIALAVVAATAAACQKQEAASSDSAPPVADRSAAEAASPESAARPREAPTLTMDLPSLAYAHDFKVEALADAIPDMMRRHEQLCIDSGPGQCQVLGSDLQSEGRDRADGRLEMRATPAWVRMFRPSLAADARNAGGELRSTGTDTEDLTQPIADTDAALKSKIEIRDRLRAMLKRPGDLEDVIRVEQELQRVQAEIDAAQSSMRQLNTRVEAVRVSVDYGSIAPIVPENAGKPFRAASGAFVRTFMSVLAGLVWIAAVALPFVIVFGPVVWMLASRRKRAPVTAE